VKSRDTFWSDIGVWAALIQVATGLFLLGVLLWQWLS
jgi:hypothetical protein